MFHAKNVTFDVVENTDIGTVVGVVTAHDRDSGENGRVSYYIISGNVFSLFTVDRITGEITSIREIDYEESSSHILGIRAIDNNALYPKSSNISVTIRVVDVNDNAPVFEQDPVLLRTVKENTPTGHAVYTFTATDKDSGQNGTVQYRITSESYSGPDPDAGSYFMIDASSGQLKIKKNIDYEKVHQISLIVEARDKCPTQDCVLNASVTTIVYVIDVNDNNPIFESPAQVEIFEDENVDYPVLYLLATDKDANENNSGNNLVTYKILSGNNADKFNLESTTGNKQWQGNKTNFVNNNFPGLLGSGINTLQYGMLLMRTIFGNSREIFHNFNYSKIIVIEPVHCAYFILNIIKHH